MRSSGDDLSEEVRLQKSGRSNDEREQRIARLQRSIHCRQVRFSLLLVTAFLLKQNTFSVSTVSGRTEEATE